MIPFADIVAFHDSTEGIPHGPKRVVEGDTWISAEDGWKVFGPEDIVIVRKSSKPYVLRGTVLSDRARFLEIVRGVSSVGRGH